MRKRHSKFDRAYRQRPITQQPEPGSFKSMSAARVRQASAALGCDPEDVTDDERQALDEYIHLGGNVWGL